MLLAYSKMFYAESSLNCKRNQSYFANPFIQQYVVRCNDSLNACIDKTVTTKQMKEEDAIVICNSLPLNIDNRFIGPCPRLLTELESLSNDNPDLVIARTMLRSKFFPSEKLHYGDSYRFADSKSDLIKVTNIDPTNIGALVDLKSYLNINEESVNQLEIEIKLQELDPQCSFDWPIQLRTIPSLLSNVIQGNRSGGQISMSLSERELAQHVKNAWNATNEIYNIAIHSSTNIRKLSYAIQSIDNPLFSLPPDVVAKISEILELDPVAFAEARRVHLVKELSSEYGTKSIHDRSHSLGMTCNEYAFQIGLMMRCLSLIDHFANYEERTISEFPKDLYEAMLSLVLSSTRDCSDDLVLVLHFYGGLSNSIKCFDIEEKLVKASLSKILERLSSFKETQEYHIIMAYVSLNESSPLSFARAISIGDEAVLHTLTMAKRLQQNGFTKESMGVIESSIETIRNQYISHSVFNEDDFMAMGYSLFNTGNENSDGEFNHILAVLIEVRSFLSRGLELRFREYSREALGWNN